MKLFGVDFVPLNEPLEKRLQAMAAGSLLLLIPGLIPVGVSITMFLLFFTRFWPFVLLYLLWIWVIKKDEGGQPINEWFCSWALFKYAANYFPITATPEPGFQLDETKNYLLCVFPHAVVPYSIILHFVTSASNRRMLFPNQEMHMATLHWLFYVPLYRELMIALGCCSVKSRCLDKVLSHSGGGKTVGLVVGGGSEMYSSYDGQYRLTLRNRKGFIKVALRNGTPLVPLFIFGETSVFRQRVFKEGTIPRRIQDMVKKITGMPPLLTYGRGVFQYNFGTVPLQKHLNITIGLPIDVPKIENPNQDIVDKYHHIFITKLTELFEKYKHRFEDDPDNCNLVIE